MARPCLARDITGGLASLGVGCNRYSERRRCFGAGLSGGQREVALLLFGLPESEGFALAGGSALVALGVIDAVANMEPMEAMVQSFLELC